MPYSPPTGTADLNLRGGYAPPTGTADLSLASPGDDRTVAIRARTAGARAAVRAALVVRGWVGARTAGARAAVATVYDPNLLSAVHARTETRWSAAEPRRPGSAERWSESAPGLVGAAERWRSADPVDQGIAERWSAAELATNAGAERWRAADDLSGDTSSAWVQSEFVSRAGLERFRDATIRLRGDPSDWIRTLPRIVGVEIERFRDGEALPAGWGLRHGAGARLIAVELERWREGTYPANAPNPGPPLPPKPPPAPWGTALKIACPLPGTALKIGRVPCVLIAEREVAKRRTYMSTNSASLVRWPDLTPLPCTSITVETDFDSWCWSLNATLAGPDAWALVQPNPLACEVLATINGQQWKFLLDVPSSARSFGSNKVGLKGRSRSAWLHAPYAPTRNLSEANPRTMAQLAEQALADSGWTVDWQALPNWVVPGGRWNSQNTPIGALIRLANATDDGLYTDPSAQILVARPRWPVASWLLDGATVDLLAPEDAVISLSQNPVYTRPLNGAYVAGVSHGALALVKIAGTDGAIQPDAPIIDELLCDEEGVAARQRGLNALSDSGAGFEMDAELLFTPEVGLVRPGMIVSVAGMKGVSRSVKIGASWSGGALKVRQSVGLERREVEA